MLTEQRSSFPRTCGKTQNTVKTEEKHEQRNESYIGVDSVCPRYADYGVSDLPAVMYGETDYAVTSENKSNRMAKNVQSMILSRVLRFCFSTTIFPFRCYFR